MNAAPLSPAKGRLSLFVQYNLKPPILSVFFIFKVVTPVPALEIDLASIKPLDSAYL